MKALIYDHPHHLVVRDVQMPSPATGEVLVSIKACGICGSDMHGYHGLDPRRVPPLILGHEAVGIPVTGRYAGQRVAINPLIVCGECPDCRAGRTNLCSQRDLIGIRRAGAFAEYVTIPERNLSPIPAALDDVRASLVEPAACAVHAVAKAAGCLHRPLNESSVLVIGGGAIGILSAFVLKSHGCKRIDLVEKNAARRTSIEKLAIPRTFDPVTSVPPPAKYDAVIDAVGSGKSRSLASQFVSPGGVIVHVGLQDNEPGFDARYSTLQEVTFIGVYTYTEADFAGALSLLSNNTISTDTSWVKTYDMLDGDKAFAELDRADTPICKIVLLTNS